jgi:hypothetical protein
VIKPKVREVVARLIALALVLVFGIYLIERGRGRGGKDGNDGFVIMKGILIVECHTDNRQSHGFFDINRQSDILVLASDVWRLWNRHPTRRISAITVQPAVSAYMLPYLDMHEES